MMPTIGMFTPLPFLSEPCVKNNKCTCMKCSYKNFEKQMGISPQDKNPLYYMQWMQQQMHQQLHESFQSYQKMHLEQKCLLSDKSCQISPEKSQTSNRQNRFQNSNQRIQNLIERKATLSSSKVLYQSIETQKMANLNQIQSHEVTQFGNSFQDSLLRRQQNQFSEFDGFRQPMAISNQKQT